MRIDAKYFYKISSFDLWTHSLKFHTRLKTESRVAAPEIYEFFYEKKILGYKEVSLNL